MVVIEDISMHVFRCSIRPLIDLNQKKNNNQSRNSSYNEKKIPASIAGIFLKQKKVLLLL